MTIEKKTPGVGERLRREGAAQKERQEMQSIVSPPGVRAREVDGLDKCLQAQIGQKLKAMYDEVANAPVPDKFLDLLRRLDEPEEGK